jgi:acetoin utilization deacetylase AcuC-like enzyme
LERHNTLDEALLLTPEAASIDHIGAHHAPEHIEQIARLSSMDRLVAVTPDTVGSPATYQAARLATGAVLQAIDAVLEGRVDNAFCAVRPPGHHAEYNQVMGFCFFNNIGIAARYLQEQHPTSKVAIIDWDVHHGNGTQHSFEDDPSVFFFSIHQFPHYPGTGTRQEQGRGPGKGFTLNAPVPAGFGDFEYIEIFRQELRPALDAFQPDFILLSAGFDAHRDDPLGNIQLTEDGFATLTREVMQSARDHCRGRLVSVLEGGYAFEATAASVEAHLQVLMAP